MALIQFEDLPSTNTPINANNLNNNFNELKAYTLYDNLTGEESVTLSDSLANYNKIEVELRITDGNLYETRTILNPNNKTWIYTRVEVSTTSQEFYLFKNDYANSGNTITVNHRGLYTKSSDSFTSYNNVRITKVVGYK